MRAGRPWGREGIERLNAVEDQKCWLFSYSFRKEAAFVPRRKRWLALHAEPFERLNKKGIFGSLPVSLLPWL